MTEGLAGPLRRERTVMSWEAWGTPPDTDPGPEPDPPLLTPAIGPRQQWCCANGCGVCSVKTVQRETSRTTCLRTGKVTNQQFQTEDVSSCCGADLMLWDEDKQDFVDWQPVANREPAN